MGFIFGDSLGNVRSLQHGSSSTGPGETTWTTSVIAEGSGQGKAVQRLAISSDFAGEDTSSCLAAAFSDGTVSVSSLDQPSAVLNQLHSWKDARFRAPAKFVGLSLCSKSLYTCTSSGSLSLTDFPDVNGALSALTATLPMRLEEWRLSPSRDSFAYGGDEVDVSVWDAERAFDTNPPDKAEVAGNKRKRGDEFLPGEVWRAKNVPNDSLGLRHPIHVTSLCFLGPSISTKGEHVLSGTLSGDVRRYDTRSGRRPVTNWTGIAKDGGIKVVEPGLADHEVFVADHRCSLLALDLRSGGTLYSYKGLSGAVTSIAPSPKLMASTALDRYCRIHSTFPPPSKPGDPQESRGAVQERLYTKSTPTVVIWDERPHGSGVHDTSKNPESDLNHEGEDIWETMADAEDA